MKVVITGAGGMVAAEFTRQFSAYAEVLALTHRQLDIANFEAVREVITQNRPDLVINCAVLGVDACELNAANAWAVNTDGAENLAKAAAAMDAAHVQMSTNFVFGNDEMRSSFLTSKDEPQPLNLYGQTKLAGERAARAATSRCFIIRTSWVFGLGKANFFSSVPRQLTTAQPIKAITDVWASSTYVRDLVSRVIEIVRHGRYETYHVVNSGLCSYYDFAREVACLIDDSGSRFDKLIEPVELAELWLSARRPRYTPLRCLVSEELGLPPMRDWKAALREYLEECKTCQAWVQ
ncbi:MAG TPA: dTDP-4-dehydrorhamnose reductase [Pyrinomonadaceae bacterium]|nr:dTDP-4-dehydrorhamnose reductase [Pyrinomonadaceae bacterium]